jgi:hypothetical protein
MIAVCPTFKTMGRMRTRLVVASVLFLLALGAGGSSLALVGPLPLGGSPEPSHSPVASSIMVGQGVSFGLADIEFDDLTVTVDGTVSSSEFNIARIVWDWGDGAVEDSEFPATHTYAQPGPYMLSVSVYDDGGTLIASQSSPIDIPD